MPYFALLPFLALDLCPQEPLQDRRSRRLQLRFHVFQSQTGMLLRGFLIQLIAGRLLRGGVDGAGFDGAVSLARHTRFAPN